MRQIKDIDATTFPTKETGGRKIVIDGGTISAEDKRVMGWSVRSEGWDD